MPFAVRRLIAMRAMTLRLMLFTTQPREESEIDRSNATPTYPGRLSRNPLIFQAGERAGEQMEGFAIRGPRVFTNHACRGVPQSYGPLVLCHLLTPRFVFSSESWRDARAGTYHLRGPMELTVWETKSAPPADGGWTTAMEE